MIRNIVALVTVFLLGTWIGSFNGTIVEVEVIKEVEVEIPFLDLTDPDLKRNLEIAANFVGKTFKDKKPIEDLHRRNKQKLEDIKRRDDQKLEDLYRQKEYSFLKREFGVRSEGRTEYSRGYEAGYQDARQEGE